MIDSSDYTPDGKHLRLQPISLSSEPIEVPVALIDEILDRGLSSYNIERLLLMRSLTRHVNFRKVNISDLVGADLTGKTVGIYFHNYEDSEWMESNEALTVAQDGGSYEFVFPENLVKCWNGECDHEDDDTSHSYFNYLESMSFSAHETVLVTEPKPDSE